MSKLSSYQYRKKEISDLQKQLSDSKIETYELANRPDSAKANIIRRRCQFHKNILDTLWLGSRALSGDKDVFGFQETKRDNWFKRLLKRIKK